MKNLLYLVGVLAMICLQPLRSVASSHREAPLISNDPLADNTDLYAFKSPTNPENVVLIANYIPFEHPAGGPNWYSFGENIRYEIHVDNNAANPGEEIIYRFTFKKMNQDPTTFFLIRLGKENLKTTYTCERSMDGGRTFSTIISDGTVPPPNIGPRSIEDQTLGLNVPDYNTLVQRSIMTATTGEKIFCGPVDDPFFVDLGGIFDLGQVRKTGARDAVAKFNCHSIVIEVPVATLQKNKKTVAQATNILDGDYVIGVYASASRRQIKSLYPGGDVGYDGGWVQVSRLGMPLTNEAVIPIGKKDRWNAVGPDKDLEFAQYFTNPELALYMDDSQFGTAVPGLADLRIQTKSLGAFDFRNGKPGLYGLKGNPALNGTALAEAAFGGVLLPDNKSPRAVDLLPIFYTGVPNLPPYQLATGKPYGNPLAAGKPFINNFLPTLGDLLRLNMAVPATPRTSADFSSLGLIQAAVLGITDARFNKNTNIEMIPNMDGFPNGRRLEDDVTTIELQAVGGAVLAAVGLFYDDANATNGGLSANLLKTIGFSAGVTKNDTTLKAVFPYEQNPWRGFRGPQYQGPTPPTMAPLSVTVVAYNCATGDMTYGRMGGDPAKTVEYAAPGVNIFTTNVNQVIAANIRNNPNAAPLMITGRYVGEPASAVTYMFDFRGRCVGARIGAEGSDPLQVRVLGNPNIGDEATVEITGATGQPLQLGMVNSQGQVISQQTIGASSGTERRTMKVGNQTGIYFLEVTSPTERQTVKIVRH